VWLVRRVNTTVSGYVRSWAALGGGDGFGDGGVRRSALPFLVLTFADFCSLFATFLRYIV